MAQGFLRSSKHFKNTKRGGRLGTGSLVVSSLSPIAEDEPGTVEAAVKHAASQVLEFPV